MVAGNDAGSKVLPPGGLSYALFIFTGSIGSPTDAAGKADGLFAGNRTVVPVAQTMKPAPTSLSSFPI